jgi:ElaB/YqjD/DUF883 family membrane-anchored ribosome-binding protein
MSEPIEGSGAAAVGAHSKDAMQGSSSRTHSDHGRSGSAALEDGASGAPNKVDDLGASLRGASDAARSAAGTAGQEAARLASTAQDGISRAGREAYRQGAQASQYVGGAVRSDPLIALAVMGALGFALGLLIGRR